jgi:uncharacterized protein
VDFIFWARKAIIAVVIALTAFFGYHLKDLKINSDVFSYLPKSDPAVALFDEIADNFGGNEIVLIAIEDKNLFSKQSFKRLSLLTEKLKGVEGVSSVTSLADVIDIKKAADGGIEIAKLVDPEALPQSADEFAKLKQYVLSQELYKGNIVSADGDMSCVICQLTAKTDKIAAVDRIKAAVAAEQLPLKMWFGGVPVMTREITGAIFSDLIKLVPIVSILIILTLLFSFGTWRGVIVPLLCVGIAVVWTIGFMCLLRVPLTIISDIIPVLLIAIGTAPCIHILSKYDEEPERRYGNAGDEPRAAFREVGLRVILTSVTIIFGFTSFIFGSYLNMIRDFGVYSSIGVFFALLLSIFFVPSLLSFVKVRGRAGGSGTDDGKKAPLGSVMHRIAQFVLKNEIAILIAGCVILVFGILGVPRIERKVDIIDYFSASSPVRSGEIMLEKKFGGSRPIQMLFKGDMQNPFVLKELKRAEKYLGSFGFINNALSVSDLISRMNDIMGEGMIVPEAADKVSNLYFLLEGQEMLTRVVNGDKSQGLVTAMVGVLDVKKMRTVVDSLEAYCRSLDTTLVCAAYEDLPEQQRIVLYGEQLNRISQQIVWDASKRNSGRSMDRKEVERLLSAERMPRLYSISDSVVRDSLAPAISRTIMALMPESLRTDTLLLRDITGDVIELAQKRVALPASRFAALGMTPSSEDRIPLSVAHTGMPLIYQHLDNSLIESQFQSFALALIFIFALLALQLRSLVSGLLGLTPIVLTVVLIFGVMGFVHIPLDVATVLVASIALGIGIDYSIHFSVRFKSYFINGATPREALEKTLQTTGKAIIINVLAVTMGFITLLFAGLVPLQRFGFLVSLTMIGSGLGALTMLPSLIIVFKQGKKHSNNQKGVV